MMSIANPLGYQYRKWTGGGQNGDFVAYKNRIAIGRRSGVLLSL